MQKIRINERDVVPCPENGGNVVPVSRDSTDRPSQQTCHKCRFFASHSCYNVSCQSKTPLPAPIETHQTPIFTGL